MTGARQLLLGELVSLARQSMTVALMWCARMRRVLGGSVQAPERARGCLDRDRCFARRSDIVAQRQVARGRSCPMAPTSRTPRGYSSLTLAMRTVVLARCDSVVDVGKARNTAGTRSLTERQRGPRLPRSVGGARSTSAMARRRRCPPGWVGGNGTPSRHAGKPVTASWSDRAGRE